MREIVKKCMIVYNLLALPFVSLTAFLIDPEVIFFSKLGGFIINWFTYAYVALTIPLQNYLIPQIVAAILIGLYAYDIIRQREFFPFRWERRSFFVLSTWTIFSAVCILLGCMALGDGRGKPLP